MRGSVEWYKGVGSGAWSGVWVRVGVEGGNESGVFGVGRGVEELVGGWGDVFFTQSLDKRACKFNLLDHFLVEEVGLQF